MQHFLLTPSKTFNFLLHEFLIAKLHVYGVQLPSPKMVQPYRVNRKQRTQINNFYRSWSWFSLRRTAKRHSWTTFYLTFFYCDFFFVPNFDIASEADNNTVFCLRSHINEVISNLKNASETRLKWFYDNCMKVNSGKYNQFINNTSESREIKG